MEFPDIFSSGGFDVQVGNPPWVRPTWDEPASLAEHDPWWGIKDLTKTADSIKRARRAQNLTIENVADTFRRDRAENEGVNSLLGGTSREPSLKGVQTNLYMLFMTSTWRRSTSRGVIGLLHPESHFVDPKAGVLRSESYQRLRRHWHFMNELFLFPEVDHHTEFAVNVYSHKRPPSFRQASYLFAPNTLDRSLHHDGTGDTPGIQHPEGGWDLRPHRERIVDIDDATLGDWVKLFDETDTLRGKRGFSDP